MSKKSKVKKVTLQVRNYGLGYPDGYRPQAQDVFFKLGRVKYMLDVYTTEGYREIYPTEKTPQIEAPWSETYEDGFICHHIVIDCTELDHALMEHALRRLLDSMGEDVTLFSFVWKGDEGKEKELSVWQKDREETLRWLTKGARPFKVVLMPQFIDDVAKAENAAADAVHKDFADTGFVPDEQGMLTKSPDEVVDIERHIAGSVLCRAGMIVGDTAQFYLSNGSWPLIPFVAGGKRYRTDEGDGAYMKRAWFGYLPATRTVVLIRNDRHFCLITLTADPDFLPALLLLELDAVATDGA